jgi:hypothetical protein
MEEMHKSMQELLARVGTVTDEMKNFRKQMEDYGSDLDSIKRKVEAERTMGMPRVEVRPGKVVLANNGHPILDTPESSAAVTATAATSARDLHVAAGTAAAGSTTLTTSTAFHTAPSSPTDHGEVRVRAPRHDFPKFRGETPLLWIDQCLTYFDMFHIPSNQWVSMASLYLEGNAALWYQAYKRRHGALSWSTFMIAILEEFGQDEYDGQMSKLMQLRQTSTVA